MTTKTPDAPEFHGEEEETNPKLMDAIYKEREIHGIAENLLPYMLSTRKYYPDAVSEALTVATLFVQECHKRLEHMREYYAADSN